MPRIQIMLGDAEYDKDESERLQKEIIQRRDEAFKRGDYAQTVILSHVVSWMGYAIEVIWAENGSPSPTPRTVGEFVKQEHRVDLK